MKIIDEDGLFSLIEAAPAPDAPPEEASPPSPSPASAARAGQAASPSAGGRRMPASFSGRAAPAPPSAAASSSHAGGYSLNGLPPTCHSECMLNCCGQDLRNFAA